MKPEPLNVTKKLGHPQNYFKRSEVASAVEWLRKKDNKLLMKRMDVLIGCGYRHIAVRLSKEINENKNKAFEDVIKDKQRKTD